MLVLFEGVDKSGKSTLLKNFQSEFALTLGRWKNTVHKPDHSVYSQGQIHGLYLGFYECFKSLGKGRYPFLIDRSHITELVYAPVKRMYAAKIDFWRKYEETLDAIVVYVDTPTYIIEKRFQEDKEDYVQTEEINLIKDGYEEYLRRSTLPVIRIDGSRTADEMVHELIDKLDEHISKRN